MKRRDTITGILCAIGCETLFGMSYLFTKTATETVSPLALLGWRFLVAAAVMSLCALLGALRIDLEGKPLKPLLGVALFNPCIYFIVETIGISRTTASESGAFLACIPVFSLAASALILKLRSTGRQIAGILITLAGVLVTVAAVGIRSSLSISGYLCLLAAVVAYALYSVYVEKAEGYSGAEITFVMMLSGAAVFGAIALAEGLIKGTLPALLALPLKNAAFRLTILCQGIGCSVLAFFLSNVAIRKIGVNRTSSFIGVSTVVSIAAGALVLGERFSAWQVIGAAVIIIGVYTANSGKKKEEF